MKAIGMLNRCSLSAKVPLSVVRIMFPYRHRAGPNHGLELSIGGTIQAIVESGFRASPILSSLPHTLTLVPDRARRPGRCRLDGVR